VVEIGVHARKRVEGQLVAWWGKCKGACRGSLSFISTIFRYPPNPVKDNSVYFAFV
jgi:hypothetical protein